MKSKSWLVGWFALTAIALIAIGVSVYKVDPYFHYHKPDTQNYFYPLDNQRSQNDGISKHFDYDALITGTSMTENFKTSEFNEIFGADAIKVPYSGGSFKEMNDNLIVAFKNNPKLKTVVRSLDYDRLLNSKDIMRTDLGKYPTYLYDSNPFNDVYYLFNKDVIFNRVYAMVLNSKFEGLQPGIQSFDSYSRWQDDYTFGANTVLTDGFWFEPAKEKIHLTKVDRKNIFENITQNVTSLADEHPDADFYYFFTPYSAAWWVSYVNDGTVYKWFEAEKYAIELILEHENIKLFSFNNRTDITTDLNNYKDTSHYGEWVNEFMLRAMHDGKYLLTKDNYKQYLEEEIAFYTTFDYGSLIDQEDYECDYYAKALLNSEITGVKAVDLLAASNGITTELSGAEIIKDKETGKPILKCTRVTEENRDHSIVPYDTLMGDDFKGLKVRVNDITDYEYLSFNGKKIADDGQPMLLIYNDKSDILADLSVKYDDLDGEWHQYLINVKDLKGAVTILFTGGNIDNCGSVGSEYLFNDLALY